jgi:hypothetical protein
LDKSPFLDRVLRSLGKREVALLAFKGRFIRSLPLLTLSHRLFALQLEPILHSLVPATLQARIRALAPCVFQIPIFEGFGPVRFLVFFSSHFSFKPNGIFLDSLIPRHQTKRKHGFRSP